MKLTDKERAEIVTEYSVGLKSKSDLAKKFNVTVQAISKILSSAEKLKKAPKSSNSLNAVDMRREIVGKATEALYGKNFDKLAPETLLKIIERLSLLDRDTPTSDPQDELKAIVDKIKEVTAEEVHNGE